ncbi:MAG: LamG-like jellyroll fold domain-containing protein [Roseibacillus sp.]
MMRPALVGVLLFGSLWAKQEFRAGSAAVDITPSRFPVRVNGGFTERSANQALDPLYARSVALDDGRMKILFCVVDTCMVPRELIDKAKDEVHRQTGLSPARMMVSATHTHSAPSAMGCLGTRMDPDYIKWLPGKLAESMVKALGNLQSARIGWASIDDWEHTHNRRWIFRLDRTGKDPFGGSTMHANMHPGHLSRNVIGPSGPVDPELSIFAVKSEDGRPLAFFANYSQHYYGSGLLSADYFGAFCRHVARLLHQPSSEGPFVAMISQGTSGDLMWMDYGVARENQSMDRYAGAVAQYAMRAYEQIQWKDHVPLRMVEKKLVLDWRRPTPERLQWAKERTDRLGDSLPRSQQDIYATEAVILNNREKAELKLQAIRIGELGITTLPNEVYALTGLKLKACSPFASQFNIELANGAEGYIPPPEQHLLGGYTTWPARTAGLEVASEPRIVETLLTGLEEVAGTKRNPVQVSSTAYRDTGVRAHWPLDDFGGIIAKPNHGLTHAPLRITGKVAYYLPGVGSGSGCGNEEALTSSPLSPRGPINRSIHLVDGYLETALKLPSEFTVALWYWLGERSGASEREGCLVRLPSGQELIVRQGADHRSRLSLGEFKGSTSLPADEWNIVILVRKKEQLQVHLNGELRTELEARIAPSKLVSLRFGERLEGKLDEIAVWDRALTPPDCRKLWERSGIAGKRATRRQAERAAAARAMPPEWPAHHTAAIRDKNPLRYHKLDHKPEGLSVERVIRFNPETRAVCDAGRMRGALPSLDTEYSASFWFRNDLPIRTRPVTAYLFSRGPDGNPQAPGDHVGIGGVYRDSYPGKLLVFNGNETDQVLIGKTEIPAGRWNHVVFVRKGQRVLAWLNGQLEINGEIKPTTGQSKDFFLGARSDFFAPLKGALAEFALFGRALTSKETRDLYNAADPRKSAGED